MSRFRWFPKPIRSFLYRYRFHTQQRGLRALSSTQSKKIIIGSSGTHFEDWVSTEREVIDLVREDTWTCYFKQDSLDAILAEHVWEHLYPNEAAMAAKTCYRFLKPGGYLRVAVPDGFHPDLSYIDLVRPGGTGGGADDHKVLYNYGSFRDLFENVGFDLRLYEYFDEQGLFHYDEWDPSSGMIQRSKRFDRRNSAGSLAYTSIVMDAIKPNIALNTDAP